MRKQSIYRPPNSCYFVTTNMCLGKEQIYEENKIVTEMKSAKLQRPIHCMTLSVPTALSYWDMPKDTNTIIVVFCVEIRNFIMSIMSS